MSSKQLLKNGQTNLSWLVITLWWPDKIYTIQITITIATVPNVPGML